MTRFGCPDPEILTVQSKYESDGNFVSANINFNLSSLSHYTVLPLIKFIEYRKEFLTSDEIVRLNSSHLHSLIQLTAFLSFFSLAMLVNSIELMCSQQSRTNKRYTKTLSQYNKQRVNYINGCCCQI